MHLCSLQVLWLTQSESLAVSLSFLYSYDYTITDVATTMFRNTCCCQFWESAAKLLQALQSLCYPQGLTICKTYLPACLASLVPQLPLQILSVFLWADSLLHHSWIVAAFLQVCI